MVEGLLGLFPQGTPQPFFISSNSQFHWVRAVCKVQVELEVSPGWARYFKPLCYKWPSVIFQ